MPPRPELLTEVSPQRVWSPRGESIFGEQCQKAPRHLSAGPPVVSGTRRRTGDQQSRRLSASVLEARPEARTVRGTREIGRASCRERVEIRVVAASVNKK